jgi:hypothetical protein
VKRATHLLNEAGLNPRFLKLGCRGLVWQPPVELYRDAPFFSFRALKEAGGDCLEAGSDATYQGVGIKEEGAAHVAVVTLAVE